MAGTLHTAEYRKIIHGLLELRTSKGVSQAALAKLIGRPPSFVAKVELCERRLDVIEFVVWISALNEDPAEFLNNYMINMPLKIPR